MVDNELSFYDVLQVTSDATKGEIKKAYKELVLKYHPDVCRDKNCVQRFKTIVKAYTVLKDDELRGEYNKTLHKGEHVLPVFKFDYYYRRFINKADELWTKVSILFKNISGSHGINLNLQYSMNNSFLPCPVDVPDEVYNMTSEALEERLEYSNNAYVCSLAAAALGLKKERRSYGGLKSKLLTADDDVKKVIIWALTNLDMQKSLQVLKETYHTETPALKSYILKAIYKITEGKGEILFNTLLTALRDDEGGVRSCALDLFLKTDMKVREKDISVLLKETNSDVKIIIDKLLHENRVI